MRASDPAARSRRAPVALLLALLVGTLLAGLAGVAGAPPGGAQQGEPSTSSSPTLTLVRQTSWVGPEGVFEVAVDAPRLPDGATVAGRLYERIGQRRDLDAALDEDDLGTRIWDVGARPAADSLNPDGSISITLPVSLSAQEDGRIAPLGSPGVYPFEVVVTGPDGEPLGRLVTTLLRITDTPGPAADPLTVGVVVPLGAPAEPALDGSPYLSDEAANLLLDTMAAVEGLAGSPLTIAPVPESMALLAGRDEQGPTQVASLAPALERELLAGPYAPVDRGAWVAAGLDAELAAQYDTGAAVLQQLVGAIPDGRTAVLDRATTGAAVRELLDLGVDSVIVPSGQISPGRQSSDQTFASGFDLQLPGDVTVPAVVADDGAAARLATGTDPVLAAQRALAELAVVQLAQSGQANGVAVVVRRETDPEALTAFVEGLAEAAGAASGSPGQPLVRPATATELLRSTAPEETTTGSRTSTLVRGYEADDPASLGSYPNALRATSARLGGLRSLAPDAPTITDPPTQALLSSGARALDPAARDAMLGYADYRIGVTTDEIVVAPEQVVTLTSSSGNVPLNLENRLQVPVRVRIVLSSAKLDFPDGSVIERTLDPATTTPIFLPVETRATGAFPLDVAISSADGVLPVTATRYTVRSTAISGVGLVLSIGAGAFLLLWWARHFRTARRDRRLVASDHPALSAPEPGGYAPPQSDPREGR